MTVICLTLLTAITLMELGEVVRELQDSDPTYWGSSKEVHMKD